MCVCVCVCVLYNYYVLTHPTMYVHVLPLCSVYVTLWRRTNPRHDICLMVYQLRPLPRPKTDFYKNLTSVGLITPSIETVISKCMTRLYQNVDNNITSDNNYIWTAVGRREGGWRFCRIIDTYISWFTQR